MLAALDTTPQLGEVFPVDRRWPLPDTKTGRRLARGLDRLVTVQSNPSGFSGTASYVISGFNPVVPGLLSRRILVLEPGLFGSQSDCESCEGNLVRVESIGVRRTIEVSASKEEHIVQDRHFLTRQLPDWVQYRDIPVADPDLVAAVQAAAETTSLDSVLLESVVSQEWFDWVDAGAPRYSDDPEPPQEDEA